VHSREDDIPDAFLNEQIVHLCPLSLTASKPTILIAGCWCGQDYSGRHRVIATARGVFRALVGLDGQFEFPRRITVCAWGDGGSICGADLIRARNGVDS
jgi:hypothetical protein